MSSKKTPLKKSDIVYHLLKSWRLILLFTLVGLIVGISLIGIGYVRGEITREYRITSSVAVLSLNENNMFVSQSPNPYKTDLDTARALTSDAMYIIKSEKTLNQVIDSLDLKNASVGTISGNLSLSRYEETEIIDITLMWRSEREGLEIMRSINQVADSTMLSTMKVGRLTVINDPKASFVVGENIGISTWIYAALIGAVAGVLFCLLRFIFSATVINASDLEDVFGLDLLATMPYEPKFKNTPPGQKDDLSIRDDIKSLAHMIINRTKLAGINKIYVTSSKHDEGRTSLIANVAVFLSELGKKTLLIDCDLRNPQLGAMFNNELLYEQTLNALYRGDSDKVDAVLHINGCLDLLPVILEKVPETFNDAMLGALADTMEGYDYVLIDAAPVGEDAEILRLNEITDAALFVVRCDYASVDTVKKSLLRIGKSGIPVLGGVFNATSGWKDALKRTKKRMDAFNSAVNGGVRSDKDDKKKKRGKNK